MKRVFAFVISLALLVGAFSLWLSAAVPTVPSNTWASTSDMAAVRAGASGTLLPDGRVLVAGGIDENGIVTATAERFSPNGGAFLATPAMQTPRANHTSTLLADGRVLVVGGTGADGRAVATAEIYDPGANVWLPAGSLHVARRGHTATRLQDGTLLVSGGDDAGTGTNTLEVFDPISLTFSVVNGTLSAARTLHAAAALSDGRVFIAGGFDGINPLASTEIYDPQADTVTEGPGLSTPRSGLSATTLLDGKVLVAGGAGPGGELATAELFDPLSNAFVATGNSLASPRQNHLAFLLPHNNQVLLVGGTAGGSLVSTAETYVPWEGNGGSFCPTGGVDGSGVCASGYAAPGLPTTGRVWAAGSTLSFPAGDSIRTGPHDGLLVLAGGTGLKSAELYGFATIKTDQSDYAPGTTVTITGSGWQPGESVGLVLREDPPLDTHPLLDVTADANGNIVSTEFVPDAHDANVRFYLTAFGTVSQAQTVFRDSPKVGSVTASVQAGAVTYGTAGSATYTITVSRGSGPGSSGNFTAALSVTTALPVGATAAFSPNPVQLTSSDASKTSTMTVLTTAATPAGSTAFTVEARTSASDFATGTGSLSVGKRSVTATVTAGSKGYDGTTAATITNCSLSGVLAGDAGNLSCSAVGPNTFSDKNVGTIKTVTATNIGLSGSAAPNYQLSTTTTSTTANITARALTVTAATNTKTYDGTTSAAATPTITSGTLAAGDTATFTESYDTKNVGTGKALTPSGSVSDGNSGNNYAYTFVNNTTGAINARAITVTAATDTKTYDGTTSSAGLPTITVGSLGTGDTASFTQVFATKNAGTGKTLIPSGTVNDGNSGSNYTYTFANNTTGVINARAIMVTAATDTKTYDGTTGSTGTPTITAGSLATGDTGSFTQVFANKNAGAGKSLIPSGTVTDGNGGNNYSVTFVNNTTGVIQARSLHVSAAGVNKTYDGKTAATVTLSDDRVGGDSLTLSYASASFADKNVGTGKTVTVGGIGLTGTDAGNYTFNATASTTANIGQRSLTVSANGVNKTYEGTTAATVTLSDNRVVGDVISVSYASASFSDKAVGTGKTVSVTGISIGSTDAGNYTVNTTASTTADITTLAITGQITATSRVYDGTTVATIASRTLGGVVGGDDVSYTGGAATFDDKNVGTGKTVTGTGLGLSGADAGNYTVNSTATTTADITPRPLTVSATGVNKTYDGTTTGTVTLSDNRVGGDVLTDSYASATFADKHVGVGKAVSVGGIGISGVDAGNYAANTTATTTADITPRTLTVSATGHDKVYDGTTAATVTLSDNRVPDDAFTASYTSAAFADPNVGAGKPVSVSGISLSGTDAGNYGANTTTTTTASITPAATTTGITAPTITFGASGQVTVLVTAGVGTPGGTVWLSVDGGSAVSQTLVGGLTTLTVAGPRAGDHSLSASYPAQGNYDASAAAGTLHVDRAGTTTSVVSDRNPAATGQLVTFTATVSSTAGAPTGWVAFTEGGTVLGTGALDLTGHATFATSSLAVGTHPVIAAFGGDTNFLGSASSALGQVVDTPPVAAGDAYTLFADTPLTVGAPGVLGNDNDAEGMQTVAATVVTGPAHAAGFALNPDGSFSYQPIASYVGADSFAYQVNDGTLDGNTVTVSLTVLAATASPVAENDAYHTTADTPLTVPAGTGVLHNDRTAVPSTAAVVTAPAHAASFTLNSDGSFDYAPTAGFSGADSFTYLANDGSTDSNLALVTIAVLASGTTLEASNDDYSVDEGSTLTVPAAGVLSNDFDTAATPMPAATLVLGPMYGAVTLNADGSFVYVPTTGFHGVDSFLYRVADGTATSNLAMVSIQVRQTTTALVTASAEPSTYGDAVTFTATLAPSDASGTVQFTIDGTSVGAPVTVVGGSATSDSITTLAAGSHTIGAAYSGDTTHTSAAGTLTHSVNPKAVTPLVTASDKGYDGTTAATIASRTLTGVVGGDVSLVGGTATFDTKDVGTGKPVTVTGLSLGGADAGNYSLLSTAAAATASITPRALTVTAHGVNKVYDGATAATVTLSDDRVPGDVFTDSYASAAFADRNVGTGKPVTVSGISVTGADAGNYTFNATANTTADITQATPTVSWSDPADIVYGTMLGATQLNATASVAGAFTYTPASGTELSAGNGQALVAHFVPADTTNYAMPADTTVHINVLKAMPTVTATGNACTYSGSACVGSGLATGSATLPVTLIYSGTGATVYPTTPAPPTGAGSYRVVAHTDGDTNHLAADSLPAGILIAKATPVITWANPATVTYPTPLTATQLNATANVPGSVAYNPAAGTILPVGVGQTLHADFTPGDTSNYSAPGKDVTINVLPPVPTNQPPVAQDKAVAVTVRPLHNDDDDDDHHDHDEYNRRRGDDHGWDRHWQDDDDDWDREWERDADDSRGVRITLSATDVDNTRLTFRIVTPPAHGVLHRVRKVSCAPDGHGGASCTARVIYLPVPHYTGPDSFTYMANDGTSNSNVAVVVVNLVPPFATFTQGAWGSSPHGGNPGAFLASNFSGVYGSGGAAVGAGSRTLRFTTANAVDAFLPSGGKAGVLTGSATDSVNSKGGGVFAGHVLALQLNVDFSNVGKTRPGLANLKIAKGKLNGWSVLAVLNLANSVLGGGAFPSGLSMSVAELSDIVAKINGNFDGGRDDDGYLKP